MRYHKLIYLLHLFCIVVSFQLLNAQHISYHDSIFFKQGMLLDETYATQRIRLTPDTIFLLDKQGKVWEKIPCNQLPVVLQQIRLTSASWPLDNVADLYEKQYQEHKSEVSGIFTGVRIALDPGHFAHTSQMAQWEKKYVRAKDSLGVVQFIFEANYTWKTARILQDMIEREGGNVMLTRGFQLSALGITATEWLDGDWRKSVDEALQKKWIDADIHQSILKLKDSKQIIRNFFRAHEMQVRAEQINQFQPHLTLSIHYNVEETNVPDKNGHHWLHNNNYSMVFVPGAYAKDELDKPADQRSFVYQNFTGQISLSLIAARIFEKMITDSLRVGPVSLSDASRLKYLSDYSIADSTGVYHRNLAILRMVRYPIILLEPFLQDHAEEFYRLQQLNCRYITKQNDTLWLPCRILETAQTYYHALVLWRETIR